MRTLLQMMHLQLRDYRDSVPSSTGDSVPALSWKGMEGDWIPVVHRVLLHPTTETIVKDIASMADASWTYKDFMVSILSLSYSLSAFLSL